MTPAADPSEAIRPFREEDRAQALAFLEDARAIDSPGHRVHVAEGEAGAVKGVALWVKPDAGEEGYLGLVAVGAPGRWDLFYRLVAAAAQDALDQGFRRGFFVVPNKGLLARIQRDFDVEPQPSGRDPVTGEPAQWRIHVDLEDALRQLERAVERASRTG